MYRNQLFKMRSSEAAFYWQFWIDTADAYI